MRNKPTTLWHSREQWSRVVSKSVASGSPAQMANVLEMALQDIAALHEAIEDELHPFFVIRPVDAPIIFRNRS